MPKTMKQTAIQQNIERLENRIKQLERGYDRQPELNVLRDELTENKKLITTGREQIKEAHTSIGISTVKYGFFTLSFPIFFI